MYKKIIGIILFGILLVAGLFMMTMNKDGQDQSDKVKGEISIENGQTSTGQGIGVEIGKEAPNFQLETLEGKNVSLKDFRGKKVLVNFWATWCPYCIQEMPDLNKLYIENKDKDFVVLAVDVGESKADVEKYIKDNPYDFEVLLDKDGRVSMEYLVRGIPTSFMIDKEGIIRGIKMNMMTYPEMNQMLDTVEK